MRKMMRYYTNTLVKQRIIKAHMTTQERALDRAATKSGRKTDAYKYNPKTNSATLKKK